MNLFHLICFIRRILIVGYCTILLSVKLLPEIPLKQIYKISGIVLPLYVWIGLFVIILVLSLIVYSPTVKIN